MASVQPETVIYCLRMQSLFWVSYHEARTNTKKILSISLMISALLHPITYYIIYYIIESGIKSRIAKVSKDYFIILSLILFKG